MKKEITNYYCDYCNSEMLKHEHEELGTKVFLRIDLPNPKGGCGQTAGFEMVLCKECSKEIGIENTGEYHNYIDSQRNLKSKLKSNKKSVISLFKDKFIK